MMSKGDKIFVTGATGFVGSYIVRSLINEGYTDITCLARSVNKQEHLSDFDTKVSWVQGDILDLPLLMDVLKDVVVIIHAAALVTFHTKNKKSLISTAMDGTANLVNVALDNAVKKFVHISSVAAIGRRKKYENITEKNIFNHTEYDTTYGLSKFLAEQEVWRAHAEGLPVTVLNPALVLGAGQWEKSSVKIFKRVFGGASFFPLGSNGVVDVRDLAQAAILAINPDVDGERFIISAENWSFKDLLTTIAQNLDTAKPKYGLTPVLSSIIWRLFSVWSWFQQKSPILTRETVRSMSVTSLYDNTKSKEILGLTYRDIHTTLNDTSHLFLETYPRGISYAVFNPINGIELRDI